MIKTISLIKSLLYVLVMSILTISFSSCENDPPEPETVIDTPKVDLMDSLSNEIARDPENQNLYLLRAQAYINRSNFEEAEKDFDRCVRVDSTYDKLYQMRGDFYYDSQKFKESKEDYEDCIKYNDQNKFCHLKKGKMELLLGNYTIAIKDINNALKIDEFYADAYFEKGRFYELQGDTALAVSSYSTAIELDPQFYFAYVQIALMYAADQNDLALEYYNSALEISPNSIEALINKGLFLQDTGWKDSLRYDEAIVVYNKAEQIQPINYIPNYNKGYVYLEYKNEPDSAIIEFNQVLQKDPYNFQSYYNLGLCYEAKGDYENSLLNLDKSLDLEPTYTLAALAKDRVLKTPN